MISIRFRRLYPRLSYLTGAFRCLRPGMQARIPLSLQRVPEPVCVIAAILEQLIHIRKAVAQRPRPDVVAHLSCRDEQVEWTSLAVAEGMKLGFHTAFGATD